MISSQQSLHHLIQPNPFFSKDFKAWIFTDPSQIENLLKDPLVSARRSNSFQRRLPKNLYGKLENLETLRNNMLFFMDGDEHALLREKTAALLKSRYKYVFSSLDGIWESQWKSSCFSGSSEIMSEVILPAVKKTMASLLGCPDSFSDQLGTWSKKFNSSMSGQATLEDFLGAEQAVTDALFAINEPETQGWVKDLFQCSNAEFSSSDKQWTILLLFMAGFDTSVSMISNVVFSIAKENDSVSDRLAGDSKQLIQSTCPVNFTMREALDDLCISGCSVKKGDRILISWVGANQYISNESTNSLDSPYAFGFGNHSCIGQALAIVQLKSCISELRKLEKQPQLTGSYAFNDNLCFHYPEKFRVEWQAFE
jgi:cytochrome P450